MKSYHVYITYDAEHRRDYERVYAETQEQAEEIALAMWNENSRPGIAKNLKATALAPTTNA
jgi:hypothetical protein